MQPTFTYAPTSSDVIHRNYYSVDSMLKNDYQRSLSFSGEAMEMIHTILARPQEGEAPTEPTTSSSSLFLRSVPLPALPASSGVNEGAVALFQNALVVEATHLQRSNGHGHGALERSQNVALAGVLLYNTGLCHHMQALSHMTTTCSSSLKPVAPASSSTTTDLLCKAHKMYTMAMSLLHMEPAPEHHQDEQALLTLAIMNNMAHIYTCFADLTSAAQCVEYMNELLETTTLCGAVDEPQLAEDCIFFSMTCTLFLRNSFVAASAA